MASWLATTASVSPAASLPKSSSSYSSYSPLCYHHSQSNLSFRLSPLPCLRISPKGLRCSSNHSCVVRAQLNEVRFSQWFSLEDLFSNIRSFINTFLEPSVAFKVADVDDGSSNAFNKSKLHGTEADDSKPSSSDPSPSPSPAAAAAYASSEESISEFIAQVASLVKLVDSRDIVELQLKQVDCELIIRKKEALPQPLQPPPPPAVMMQPPPPPPPPPAAAVPPTHQPSQPVAQSAPSLPAPKSSNLRPLKCPMAGTFYRCPAPGEPPFVKVGDKVTKGQVLCLIEAMKLMNEIEADKSGTIVEVLAEDGKPVSVDTPLFVIEP